MYQMDAIDYAILEILKDDGRCTYSDIGGTGEPVPGGGPGTYCRHEKGRHYSWIHSGH